MRPLLTSLGLWGLAMAALAQNHSSGNAPQIPVGQTYKNFEFPRYQNGQLSYTLSADSATGLTINRAQTINLKIETYTDGKVTTTITSPNADLYVAERKMRTKNTVKVDRADMVATSQDCDFDLVTKQYMMREKVRVVLKNFDAGGAAKRPSSSSAAADSRPTTAPAEQPMPAPDAAAGNSQKGDSLLDTPGSYANTNSAPIPPTLPANP